MKKNRILELWQNNKACINGWLSIPNSFTAEAMSKMGWDSITIDMQHGLNDYNTSISMLQAIANSNTVALTRVPWNEPGIIMKMLDLGVMGIIAPMINTKKECEDFVSYCNYPPRGQRSFGPMRAQLVYGSDYYDNANDQIISLAMIETKEAVDNIDEILSVPGIDVLLVGPSDLSIELGVPLDYPCDTYQQGLDKIASACKNHGVVPGMYFIPPDMDPNFFVDKGFKFFTVPWAKWAIEGVQSGLTGINR